MSEYQFVAFRAVDGPLDDRQLAYAEKQSSRADLSRWEMSVEYDYSEFRGDVNGLLKRGFDVFLRYADYGIHEIRMRLPRGLPLAKSRWKPFVDGERLTWDPDKKGKAGILCLCPYIEPGDIDPVWEFDSYLDAAVNMRERLIAGDPRPLYAMWLCASIDSDLDPAETLSPDVPAGLADIAPHTAPLLEFYGLDSQLVIAAGEKAGPTPSVVPPLEQLQDWLSAVPQARTKELLSKFMTDDPVAVKAELMAEVRDRRSAPAWPMSRSTQSLKDLMILAEEHRQVANAKAAKKAAAAAKREAASVEKKRQARMKEMVAAPKQWLGEAEKLVEARGRDNYEAAADILADLQEAIGGQQGEKMTRKHAAHLAKKHPTLNRLKSSLRKRGLLD